MNLILNLYRLAYKMVNNKLGYLCSKLIVKIKPIKFFNFYELI